MSFQKFLNGVFAPFRASTRIGSIKGGVGKSTIATNLAVFFASQKVRTTLWDADRQLTSLNWWNDRQSDDILSESVFDDISTPLQARNSTEDVIIVDCQGRDGIELRSTLVVADILITPFKPSQADVDTLYSLDTIISDAKELNPGLRSLGVVSIAPTGKRSETEIQSTIEAVKENVANFICLESILFDRKAYRDAIGTGVGVCELKGPRLLAPSEFLAFSNEVKHYYGK